MLGINPAIRVALILLAVAACLAGAQVIFFDEFDRRGDGKRDAILEP